MLFADDTKIASSLRSNEEMKTLKRLLTRIYRWVDDHKMVINPDKTEHIHFGKLPIEEEGYNTPDRTKIKKVECVKDLGVLCQSDGSFKAHITDVKTRAINMSSWLLRTFKNWSLGFMSFLYRTYILPITDYCSQLYSPTRFNKIESLEAIPRVWTRSCSQIRHKHFWDRLKLLGIDSIQRRQERFRIILCWKILEGLVPQQRNIKGVWKPYRGRQV